MDPSLLMKVYMYFSYPIITFAFTENKLNKLCSSHSVLAFVLQKWGNT